MKKLLLVSILLNILPLGRLVLGPFTYGEKAWLGSCLGCFAQNPYMPLWEFIPDGEPYVFEDPDCPGKYRVYVYGSHDILVDYYCGRDQVVWSAPVENLSDWRYDGVIFTLKKDAKGNGLAPLDKKGQPAKNAKKAVDGVGDVLYAPDVAEVIGKDGKKTYYLYPNVQDDKRASAVAKSDRPDGPFEVCNWDPNDPKKTVGPLAFDPGVLVDTDGRVYGYWGFGISHGAELDPATMATVKPGTEIVEHMIPGFQENDYRYRFFEASSIRKIKDKYVYIYSRMTNDGEDGLPATNYTLAYCYSNNPLGPWTYGGTIIDGRGKEQKADGTWMPTACFNGNTHGSICEINGKWWVFYHRQAGTSEYSRQACVAPINVEVFEGPSGMVRISEAEFTCEGFQTEGLDPYKPYAAGIACYYKGPKPDRQEYPNMIYSGSHTQIYRLPANKIPAPKTGNYYDPSINRCSMVNNNAGSVFGYKYFNFSKTYGKTGLKLAVNYEPEGTAGKVDIYIDRPSEKDGGVKIGSFGVPAEASAATDIDVPVENLKYYNGKHALFFVFSSDTKDKSICKVHSLQFK